VAVTAPPRLVAYLTRRHADAVEAAFAAHFDVVRNANDTPLSADGLTHALRTADVLVPTVTDALTHEVLGTAALRTRLIANVGVGVNHIDLAAATRLGLTVTNTPDVLTDDTADLTIALMLMASRRLGEGERLVRTGAWQGLTPTFHLGRTLHGATLGIVGYGRIGRAVAHRARAFGMHIRWIGRTGAAFDTSDREHAASLEALLATSDIVSLHAPATAESAQLMNAARIALMKPGSMLINTARGSLVDESALASALATGHLFAAGLDVHEHEPLIHPQLRTMENVVLLPHLGSATTATRTAMGLRALENALLWQSGAAPRDRVV
jgi:glyoxylate reductase